MQSPLLFQPGQNNEQTWVPMAEWILPCAPRCEPTLVEELLDQVEDRIAAAGISPRVGRRVRGIIIRAALTTAEKARDAGDEVTIAIRLFIQSSAQTQDQNGGWGHFLIEHIRVIPEQPQSITGHNIDMYLYREGTHSGDSNRK